MGGGVGAGGVNAPGYPIQIFAQSPQAPLQRPLPVASVQLLQLVALQPNRSLPFQQLPGDPVPELPAADAPAPVHPPLDAIDLLRIVRGPHLQQPEVRVPSRTAVLKALAVVQPRSVQPLRPRPDLRQKAQARPTVPAKPGHGRHARARRVQVDVVDQVQQMAPGLHDQGLEAALEQMPALLAETVEPGREGRLEPPDALGKIPQRSRQADVVVVRHQAVGLHLPAETPAGLEKALLEGSLRPLAFEDPRAVVSTVDHVVDAIAGHDAILARHAAESDGRRLSRQTEN